MCVIARASYKICTPFCVNLQPDKHCCVAIAQAPVISIFDFDSIHLVNFFSPYTLLRIALEALLRICLVLGRERTTIYEMVYRIDIFGLSLLYLARASSHYASAFGSSLRRFRKRIGIMVVQV